MSWSTKLILVFIAFGLFMSYMIYRCMNVPVNLVSKAYYNDELKYQEVIDAKKNTLSLAEPVSVTIDDGQVTIGFPEQFRASEISGSILLYNPQQLKNDKIFEIRLNEPGIQYISHSGISSGRYIAKINWNAGGKPFYQETELRIP